MDCSSFALLNLSVLSPSSPSVGIETSFTPDAEMESSSLFITLGQDEGGVRGAGGSQRGMGERGSMRVEEWGRCVYVRWIVSSRPRTFSLCILTTSLEAPIPMKEA